MRVRRATTWKIALAAALAALLAACGSSGTSNAGSAAVTSSGPALTKSVITFGNIGTYTGSFGPQYEQSLQGLRAWAAWTNNHGGLNGHPVAIDSIDDTGDPTKALSAAKTLVEADHVVAFVDMMTPGTDSAYASYVSGLNIPVIGGIPLDTNWTANPDFFPTASTTVGFDTAQFNAVREVKGTKLGVFLCQFAACESNIPLFQQIAGQLGIAYAGVQQVNAASPNFTASCLQFRNQGVDTVIPELDGPTSVRVIDDCYQQSYKPKVIVPASTLDAQSIANPSFSGALGVTESPLWFGSDAQNQDWYKEFTALNPNEAINGFSTLGWQAGVVMAAALADAPDNVTSQDVLTGLYSLPANDTFGGWTPALTYAKGKPAVAGACLWVAQVENRQLTAPQGTGPVCVNTPGA